MFIFFVLLPQCTAKFDSFVCPTIFVFVTNQYVFRVSYFLPSTVKIMYIYISYLEAMLISRLHSAYEHRGFRATKINVTI
jgi:hypothetical protein